MKIVVWLALFLCGSSLWAGGRLPTREEALASVYPGSHVQAERIFLTARQMESVKVSSGMSVPSPLIARYLILKENRVEGRAYVDTHIVRTKKESLLICLSAEGTVRRIEVTAFLEPPEYLPSEPWLRQYEGRPLDDDLNLQRAIRSITGATLTSMAANQAVRRVLAIDKVLREGTETAK